MGSIKVNTEIITIKLVLLQLIFMACTTVIIFGALNYTILNKRPASEPAPMRQNFTPKDRSTINMRPTTIDVGFFIRNFSVFDMVKGEFTFSGSVWFEFDPYRITLNDISDFTFFKGTILEKSEPQTYLNDGKTHARYDIKVAISSPLEYQRFPIDSHRIDISLVHRFLGAESFLFASKNTTFQMNKQATAETAEWQMIRKFVKCGYISEQQNKYSTKTTLSYPVAYFTIEYFRKGMRNTLLILLPILLMLFIALFAILLNQEQYKTSIISISTATLTTVIAYRFIIENISPKGGYFMLSDYLYFIFLLALFVIFLLSFVIDKLTSLQKQIFVMSTHIIVTFCSVYFILKS